MFTGIVEILGTLVRKEKVGANLDLWVKGDISDELQIDQSVAHDGICLTVVEIEETTYRVTAIEETLKKTNLDALKVGDSINLERCMTADGRFDGHIVQGHVDTVATIENIESRAGSWNFTLALPTPHDGRIVEKGSVCLNGVSLTVVDVGQTKFSVSIIPYTYEFTTFNRLKLGDKVNVEYDILGKYVIAALEQRSMNTI